MATAHTVFLFGNSSYTFWGQTILSIGICFFYFFTKNRERGTPIAGHMIVDQFHCICLLWLVAHLWLPNNKKWAQRLVDSDFFPIGRIWKCFSSNVNLYSAWKGGQRCLGEKTLGWAEHLNKHPFRTFQHCSCRGFYLFSLCQPPPPKKIFRKIKHKKTHENLGKHEREREEMNF